MTVKLRLQNTTASDPIRGWVAAELYDILADGLTVGTIQLRLGQTDHIRFYGGHVGCLIEPEYRGHGYASAGLTALRPIACGHGFDILWITCRPDNIASQRTLAKAGALYVETLDVPLGSDLYARGDLQMRRYRLVL